MSSRSPGPWSTDRKVEGSDLDMHCMVYCDDALGSRVADCSPPSAGHGITREQCEANAAFIVQCENHWDELTEAASMLVNGAHAPHPDAGDGFYVSAESMERLRKALANAGVS